MGGGVKSSFHNDCVAGPRWTARCGVLSRARIDEYGTLCRATGVAKAHCLAFAHRTSATRLIMKGALAQLDPARGSGPRRDPDPGRTAGSEPGRARAVVGRRIQVVAVPVARACPAPQAIPARHEPKRRGGLSKPARRRAALPFGAKVVDRPLDVERSLQVETVRDPQRGSRGRRDASRHGHKRERDEETSDPGCALRALPHCAHYRHRRTRPGPPAASERSRATRRARRGR